MELPVADLAASFRKAVVDCLVQNFQKAAEDFHCTTLVTAGGVFRQFLAAEPSGGSVRGEGLEALYAAQGAVRRQRRHGGSPGLLRVESGKPSRIKFKRLRYNVH